MSAPPQRILPVTVGHLQDRNVWYCGVCGNKVDPTENVRWCRARWYRYSQPVTQIDSSSSQVSGTARISTLQHRHGWQEWGQFCASCLAHEWRSMERSLRGDVDIFRGQILGNCGASHDEWHRRLFVKVIRRHLRVQQNSFLGEDLAARLPENYTLERFVIPPPPGEEDDYL